MIDVCGLSLIKVCTCLRIWSEKDQGGHSESCMKGDSPYLFCKQYSCQLDSLYQVSCINLLYQNPCKKYSGHLGSLYQVSCIFLQHFKAQWWNQAMLQDKHMNNSSIIFS